MALQLIIGNKNYSSWSFRPWIAMKVAGIAFDEEVISLDAKDFKERVTRISGTGKVPALATSRSGIRFRSWNISPRSFPAPGSGRRIPPRAHTPVPLPPRCMRASCRCGGHCQ